MNIIREVLAHFHLSWLSCLVMLLFMGIFTGAILWVYRRGSGEFYTVLSDLPLEDSVKLEKGKV